VFPQEILQSLLQLDGSADTSSHPATSQQDHSEATNSTSVAGCVQEICICCNIYVGDMHLGPVWILVIVQVWS